MLPSWHSESSLHTGTHPPLLGVSISKHSWPASHVPSSLHGTKHLPDMHSEPLGQLSKTSSQNAEQKPPFTPLSCSVKQCASGTAWQSASISHWSPTLPSHAPAASQSLSAQSTSASL